MYIENDLLTKNSRTNISTFWSNNGTDSVICDIHDSFSFSDADVAKISKVFANTEGSRVSLNLNTRDRAVSRIQKSTLLLDAGDSTDDFFNMGVNGMVYHQYELQQRVSCFTDVT